MSNNVKVLKGKKIRDPIHGDVFFPEQFLSIIDTPEFQRLRRIHQLSVAYLVFPGANHTRFSHSIGTYSIMQKIIEHFRPIMKSINLKLDERDINLALCVALLHDIGHGPFSHAFEGLTPYSKDHEDWTIEIIKDGDSNINKVLKEKFDDNFPNDLADIIKKERTVGKIGFKNDGKIDLFFILSALISSQLDADRMDYLLRDSGYTGVTFGSIDIERLISSMTLTVNNNNYYVCFINKYVTDIEEYLLARYQMLKEIYLHPVKCEMEMVIKKIFKRAIENIKNGDTYIKETIPAPLLELFQGKEMELYDYISLDDNILLGVFSSWVKATDPILSKLCSCIISREKYKKIRILDNTEDNINKFKIELSEILDRYGYNITDYEKEYFWIELKKKYNIYKVKKDNIWILDNDGTINDICTVSNIINERLNKEKIMTFINIDIIKEIIGVEHNESAISDIKNLTKLYDSRNHIEIEKKYILDSSEVFEKVEKIICNLKDYVVEDTSVKYQEDYYYDTDDRFLLKEDKTLRFRKIDDNIQLTIKTPTKERVVEELQTGTQSERFEYEVIVNTDKKEDNKDNIIKYLPEFKEQDKWDNLRQLLIIKNDRKKIKLTNNNVLLEMVFDNVEYDNKNSGKTIKDYQIEIELKSDYIHRINLKMFSDLLEEKIPELKPMNESKYKRGTRLTK